MTDPLDLAPLTTDAVAADARLTDQVAESRHPLVLLPVRLETRFRDGELLVRVYPDQLHVDAHDPRVSAAEIAAGEEFWRAQWRTGTDRERAQRAWSALADRWGPGRAAWVVRATTPTNPQARPDAAVADGAPLSVGADLPRPPAHRAAEHPGRAPAAHPRGPRPPTRRGRWSRSPPGRPITADLAVGPDLSVPLVHEEHGDDEDDEVAAVDRAMSWLVDFATAEEVGMALRLPVSGPVDLLLVTGVRDAGDGAGDLGRLFSTPSATARGWRSSTRRRRPTTPRARRPAGPAPPPGRGRRRPGAPARAPRPRSGSPTPPRCRAGATRTSRWPRP